jgi:hypothetical protein
VADRLVRTLKEQAIYGRVFHTVEDFRQAVDNFVGCYNRQWGVKKNGFKASRKSAKTSLITACTALTYNILSFIGQLGLLGDKPQVVHSAKRRQLKTAIREHMYLAARLIARVTGCTCASSATVGSPSLSLIGSIGAWSTDRPLVQPTDSAKT